MSNWEITDNFVGVCCVLLSILVVIFSVAIQQPIGITIIWAFMFVSQGIIVYFDIISQNKCIYLLYSSVFCRVVIILAAIMKIVIDFKLVG